MLLKSISKYEGIFLKKIKRVSLALLSSSVLFSGCTQEKVSTIAPSKATNSKISLKMEIKNQQLTNQNNTSSSSKTDTPKVTSNQILLDSSILEELAFSIQSTMSEDMDIAPIESEKIVLQPVELEEQWEAFTKEDEILETAKEYLGVQYIWAANGPSAFDCSGYTKYVFKQNGITLPRYSGHQANVGTSIQYDELKKGDLVFFDTAKGFHGKVNHVGIYIGDNKFIHASSARKKVMITSFSQKKFYKNRFLHGQRIVDSSANFASYNVNSSIHTN